MAQTRKLGRLEKLMLTKDNIFNCVVPTQLSIKKKLDIDLLKKAVYLLIKSQPNFNSVLKSVEDDVYFSPLEELKDYFEKLPSETDWKKQCLKYCNNNLRDDYETFSPLKLFLIQPSEDSAVLILVYSHYCGDGTNGMSMTNDILSNYVKLKESSEYEPHAHSAPPSVDDMGASVFSSSSEMKKRKDGVLKLN